MRAPGAELWLAIALFGCGRGRAHRDDAAIVVPPPPPRDVTPPLGIRSTSPDLGPAGNWVYVNGWGFKGGATVEVGGASTVAFVYDIDQLGFAVPAAASGTTRITVHVGALEATSPHDFTVGIPHERTQITDFDPATGPGGTYVTVNGAGFVFGATTVRFGDHALPAYVFGPSQLTFTVPVDARHDEQVIVECPNGTAHSDGQFHVR